jgi:CheY-like chemotaxis protein
MRASGKSRSWNILLVEDNAADVRLTREVLRHSARNLALHVARDGEQALAMLKQPPEPDLVLLDLNLPRLHGRDVLARMKADPRLKHIPVIVLSTSGADSDVAACYQLHANCYLQKPMDVDSFAGVMRQLEEFWFSQVALPPKASEEYRVG